MLLRGGMLLGALALGLLFAGIVLAATPVADNKTVTTDQATPVTITLSASHDGGALDFAVASSPSNGVLDITSGTMTCDAGTPALCTADVQYTPNAGPLTDSFTYTATNATDGTSPPATVSITADAAPVAVDDPDSSCVDGVTGSPKKYIVIEDQPLTIDPLVDCGLLTNDTDPDSDPLTAAKATNPAHGTATVTAAGGFTYTPNANYNGLDSFTYTASDGVLTDTATVSITVLAVDDPPNAVNDTTLVVGESTGANNLAVLANDTVAPDTGETLSIISTTQGSHGVVAITGGGTGLTYDPAQLYVGTDTFTYTVKDSGGNATDTATVVVTVAKDVTPPVVGYPTESIRTALSMTQTSFSVREAWSGSDAGVGLLRFDLQRSVDGGAWTAQALATPLTTSVNANFGIGHIYHYRVRAVDKNGNASAWHYSQYLNATRYEETSGLITYVGTWTKSLFNSSYSGGYTKYAFGGTKTATFTVTARDFAFVGPMSSTRGTARIYLDGVLVATVSETSSSSIYRRVLWAHHFSTLASHTLRVYVIGSSRIDVDCFLALR
jgi:VCBS repeat-containing protein